MQASSAGQVARPAGRGPWPPVLYIHAKRGFEDIDREHMRALARDGFLVLAPDWLSGNMIANWPDRHHPETEADVEAGLDALLADPDACRTAAGIVAKSRGPYFAIRIAAKRPSDVAAIVSLYGHFRIPTRLNRSNSFPRRPRCARSSPRR